MNEISAFAGCLLTDKPDAYAFTGLVVGGIIAFGIAFLPRFNFLHNYTFNINQAFGSFLGVAGALLGALIGEVVRVLWTGQCHPL